MLRNTRERESDFKSYIVTTTSVVSTSQVFSKTILTIFFWKFCMQHCVYSFK